MVSKRKRNGRAESDSGEPDYAIIDQGATPGSKEHLEEVRRGAELARVLNAQLKEIALGRSLTVSEITFGLTILLVRVAKSLGVSKENVVDVATTVYDAVHIEEPIKPAA